MRLLIIDILVIILNCSQSPYTSKIVYTCIKLDARMLISWVEGGVRFRTMNETFTGSGSGKHLD